MTFRPKHISIPVTCLLLAACSFLGRAPQPRFRIQEDVGSVQVGVQSVAPFEDYISSLEPQFELKPQEALDRAIAQTQVEDSALVSQFLTTLQIALPQITHTHSTSSVNDGTKTTDTSNDAHSTTPGTATLQTAPAVLAPTVTTAIPAGSTVELDSALRYRAATALAQEVSLLNHYVRNAAVRTGTKPYIVRLLVTVMPGMRNEPYDAYATVSFFTKATAHGQQLPIRTQTYEALHKFVEKDGPPDERGKVTTVLFEMNPKELAKTLDESLAVNCEKSEPVNVIPLLVTDDLESSMHTDALQRIRDIAVALQGTLSNIGVASGTRIHTEDLDKTLNRNLNSIYALGQPAPNAVVARLGATYANGTYVAVPRSYGVTLLVLVKTAAAYDSSDPAGDEAIPCPGLTFTAMTQMHNAQRHGFVPPRPIEDTKRELRQLLQARDIRPSDGDLSTLLKAAAAGDYSLAAAITDAQMAWPDAVWVSQRSGRSAGELVVSLPRVGLPSNVDHFSLLDDGETTTLSINHAANLLPDRLHANIKAQFDDHWVFLPNTDVKVSSYGRSAQFSFPSLSRIIEAGKPPAPPPAAPAVASLKKTRGRHAATRKASPPPVEPAAPAARASQLKHVYAEVTYNRSLTSWTGAKAPELTWYPMVPLDSNGLPVSAAQLARLKDADVDEAQAAHVIGSNELPISYAISKKAEAETPKAKFTISVPAAVIADLAGAGNMLVEIRDTDPADTKIHLQLLEGAFIDKTSEPPLDGPDHVGQAGAWLLSLHGLRPGTPIVLHAYRMAGEKKVAAGDLTIPVLAAPEIKPKEEPKKN